jgi:plasmid stability protein
MKNVTITLPDDVLARARVEAARQGKSLSRYVTEIVEERCPPAEDPATALIRFLDGPGLPGASKDWPTREEIYAEREEELVRRYESHRLRDRSERAGETGPVRGMAEEPGQEPYAGPQPPKPE